MFTIMFNAFWNEMWVAGMGNEVLLTFLVVAMPTLFVLYHLMKFISKCVTDFFTRPPQVYAYEEEASNVQELFGDVVERPLNEDRCCICLESLSMAVETNCGHLFCGYCLQQTFYHRPLGEVIKPCPLCRASVTLIMFRFTAEERAVPTDPLVAERKAEIQNFVTEYNRLSYGVPRTFREILRDVPFLIRNFVADFFSFRGIIYLFQLRMGFYIILAFAYLISPMDVIPESVHGILGYFDDIFVFMLLCFYVTFSYRELMLNNPNLFGRL